MTERYLFFNSAEGDKRRHQASDMAGYWSQVLTNGLFHLDKVPKLKVTANTNDMRVSIEPGSANINGYFYFNDADMFKFIEGADPLLDRIDRIVLRWDNTIESRFIKVFVVEGVPAENPVPPELTRTEDIHELSLAQVRVRAGKSFIEQTDIVDERLDNSVCGLVSSLVTIPTDVFYELYQNFIYQNEQEWRNWFDNVVGQSYVTNEELDKKANGLAREIANLNLQLEANKRVVNGSTFGTDFVNTFGMEIDTTKVATIEALPAGTTVLNGKIGAIKNGAFEVGQEVTVFDDVNYEYAEITSVSPLTITPLVNSYKAAAVIARTNYDVTNNQFGVWSSSAIIDDDCSTLEGFTVLSGSPFSNGENISGGSSIIEKVFPQSLSDFLIKLNINYRTTSSSSMGDFIISLLDENNKEVVNITFNDQSTTSFRVNFRVTYNAVSQTVSSSVLGSTSSYNFLGDLIIQQNNGNLIIALDTLEQLNVSINTLPVKKVRISFPPSSITSVLNNLYFEPLSPMIYQLLINDIRFTTKKETDEVVTWVNHDGNLAIEAEVNGLPMNRTESGNETQLIASKTFGETEVKLKLSRQETVNGKINKILGGVG